MLPDFDRTTAICDHGQIGHMPVPPGWEEGEPDEYLGGGYRSFREVHPRLAPAAMLCFFYRGGPIRKPAAERLRRLFLLAPHMLSAAEIKDLGEVLRDKRNPNDFAMAMARTEQINGRLVLVVEGRYREVQEDVRALFVDADGSGRFVQEIYFQAPKDLYLKYLRAAREAMFAITWR